MTKADIVEKIYRELGFSKKDATGVVEDLFSIMKENLRNGEKVKISGFGNFVVRVKRARLGRNPQSGKDIEISPRRVLTFRPSQLLKQIIN